MSPVSPVFHTVVKVRIVLKTQLEWEHPFLRIICPCLSAEHCWQAGCNAVIQTPGKITIFHLNRSNHIILKVSLVAIFICVKIFKFLRQNLKSKICIVINEQGEGRWHGKVVFITACESLFLGFFKSVFISVHKLIFLINPLVTQEARFLIGKLQNNSGLFYQSFLSWSHYLFVLL